MTREEQIEITSLAYGCVGSGIDFEAGAKWADANPKSSWISVEDDLPCNHEEMVVSSGVEEKDTLIVLVRFAVGFVDFAYMHYSNNEWRWNTYFKVSHWMFIPEFKED